MVVAFAIAKLAMTVSFSFIVVAFALTDAPRKAKVDRREI
jgi:hypothetical protein